MKVLAIQCVFFNPDPGELEKLCLCLSQLWTPEDYRLDLRTGNCGDAIPFPSSFQESLTAAGIAWTHVEFGENLGFGAGQNRLFKLGPRDRIWLLNPDALFACDTLTRLSQFADDRPDSGIVEPRLSPLEHPKAVDFDTYETGWCSGCAPLIDSALFEKVGGFDESFFLYSEDVDLSWRIKAAGGKLYCCPWASVYHWRDGSESESTVFWVHVSELLLLRKYRRKGHLKCRLADLSLGDHEWLARVLREVTSRLYSLATAQEGSAASWSGRLNSALRWESFPVYVPPGEIQVGVSVSGGEPNDAVESALGAWAAGANEIYLEVGKDRLPFPPPLNPGEFAITGGQVPFRSDLSGVAWVRVAGEKCGEGWLAAGVIRGVKSVRGVERVKSTGRPTLVTDHDDWRFVVRQLRASVRLSKLSPELVGLVRQILDF